MAEKILKIGSNSNSQKMVFSMLIAILLLEFGSLTKLQAVWKLAFSATTPGTTTSTGTPVNATVNVTPNTHPSTVKPGMPV